MTKNSLFETPNMSKSNVFKIIIEESLKCESDVYEIESYISFLKKSRKEIKFASVEWKKREMEIECLSFKNSKLVVHASWRK